jgi:hypothetical protein
MSDSRKAEGIRDILRLQFEIAAQTASQPTRSALFSKLAASTADIPPVMLDAYSELFEDLTGSEIEQEMMTTVGVSWWPESARSFVEKYIAISTGAD